MVLEILCRKNPSQNRAGGVAQGVSPDFKPHYQKKKKKQKKSRERNQMEKEHMLFDFSFSRTLELYFVLIESR
jgi:hypothetical protein